MIHGLTVHACHKRDKQLLGVMNVFFVGNGCRAVPVSGRGTKHKSRHASAGEMDRPAVRSAVAEHVFLQRDPLRARDRLSQRNQFGWGDERFVVQHQRDIRMNGARGGLAAAQADLFT